jgi:hypothetical protein
VRELIANGDNHLLSLMSGAQGSVQGSAAAQPVPLTSMLELAETRLGRWGEEGGAESE